MTDLYAGTQDGLFIVSETDTGWNIRASYLEGLEINGIAVAGGGTNAVYAATRREGLFRVDLASGEVTQPGAEILPKVQRCIAVSPHDPEVIFVGTQPAGIFKTSDGGRSWQECKGVAELAARRKWTYPVPVVPPHIRDVRVDIRDPDTVYAAGQVGGVLKSTDGGESWTDFTEGLDPDVHMIAQDRQNPDTIYAVAGGGGGILMENIEDYPPPLPHGRPIYRSNDGGASWECISLDFQRTYGIQMAIHPRHPERLLAAVARGVPPMWASRPEKADAIVVYSHDGGKSWSDGPDGLPARFKVMVEAITIAEQDGQRAFLSTGGEGTKHLTSERSGEIYSSAAFDRGWQKLPVKLPSIFNLVAV